MGEPNRWRGFMDMPAWLHECPEDPEGKRWGTPRWGRPTGFHIVEVGKECIQVPCWKVLCVVVEMRDTLYQQTPWQFYASYPVKHWRNVEPVFTDLFGTAGLYHRRRFLVEEWVWTAEVGWEYNDQL